MKGVPIQLHIWALVHWLFGTQQCIRTKCISRQDTIESQKYITTNTNGTAWQQQPRGHSSTTHKTCINFYLRRRDSARLSSLYVSTTCFFVVHFLLQNNKLIMCFLKTGSSAYINCIIVRSFVRSFVPSLVRMLVVLSPSPSSSSLYCRVVVSFVSTTSSWTLAACCLSVFSNSFGTDTNFNLFSFIFFVIL